MNRAINTSNTSAWIPAVLTFNQLSSQHIYNICQSLPFHSPSGTPSLQSEFNSLDPRYYSLSFSISDLRSTRSRNCGEWRLEERDINCTGADVSALEAAMTRICLCEDGCSAKVYVKYACTGTFDDRTMTEFFKFVTCNLIIIVWKQNVLTTILGFMPSGHVISVVKP